MPLARDLQPSAKPPNPATRGGGVVIGRRTLVGGGVLTVLTLTWAAATTWYIASRDELAQHVFARQTELRYAYEDRISELNSRLEREITGNLVERNGFAARAAALAARQVEIEARQSWLSGLAERSAGGAASLAGAALPARAALAAGAGPARLTAQVSDPDGTVASGKPVPVAEPFGLRLRSPEPDRPRDRLSAIEQSLGRVSEAAHKAADSIRRRAGERALGVRLALEGTRLDLDRLIARPASSGAPVSAGSLGPAGGPLVPMPSGFDTGSFGPLAADAEARLAELDGLLAAAHSLPLRRPVAGDAEPTSGFGYRLDPFTRGPALHTGTDFRAETGSRVLAAARGRVVSAEYAGGYGNMVEIDHGAGISTRYGHLSSFAVTAGTIVEAGQVVGGAGSTGRSTGSHLHYETRVDGEPVNPARFLAAGAKLNEVLAR